MYSALQVPGRALFDLYLPLVDNWVVFDNSDRQLRQVAVGGDEGRERRVIDEERWVRLLTLAVLARASASWPGGELFDPVSPVHDDGQAHAAKRSRRGSTVL
jgi:hypothetical protein